MLQSNTPHKIGLRRSRADSAVNVAGGCEVGTGSSVFDRKRQHSRSTVRHQIRKAQRTNSFPGFATIYFRCAVIYIFTRKVSHQLNIYQKHIPLTSLDKCSGITYYVISSTAELNAEKYRTRI